MLIGGGRTFFGLEIKIIRINIGRRRYSSLHLEEQIELEKKGT